MERISIDFLHPQNLWRFITENSFDDENGSELKSKTQYSIDVANAATGPKIYIFIHCGHSLTPDIGCNLRQFKNPKEEDSDQTVAVGLGLMQILCRCSDDSGTKCRDTSIQSIAKSNIAVVQKYLPTRDDLDCKNFTIDFIDQLVGLKVTTLAVMSEHMPPDEKALLDRGIVAHFCGFEDNAVPPPAAVTSFLYALDRSERSAVAVLCSCLEGPRRSAAALCALSLIRAGGGNELSADSAIQQLSSAFPELPADKPLQDYLREVERHARAAASTERLRSTPGSPTSRGARASSFNARPPRGWDEALRRGVYRAWVRRRRRCQRRRPESSHSSPSPAPSPAASLVDHPADSSCDAPEEATEGLTTPEPVAVDISARARPADSVVVMSRSMALEFVEACCPLPAQCGLWAPCEGCSVHPAAVGSCKPAPEGSDTRLPGPFVMQRS